MSQNATPEEVMGNLHSIVTKVLIDQLDGTPILNDEGEEIGRSLDPRFVTAAITFLNNNKVVASPFVVAAMSEIEEKIAKMKDRKFRIVKDKAKDDALRAAGLA